MILSEPPARHPFTTRKVVLLSGLADPGTCALSPIQRRFLDAIDAPAESKVYLNFPYVSSTRPRVHPPLWLASIRNYAQFLRASKPAYRDRARLHWRALLESTESLVVITGSCGLEILNHCVVDDDDCVDGASPTCSRSARSRARVRTRRTRSCRARAIRSRSSTFAVATSRCPASDT
jgi:hypothetical protein